MTDSAATHGPTTSAPLLDGLADRLGAIGVALDAFTAVGTDAVRRRDSWQAALTEPLPEHGVGADAVLAELADVVVPNGTRLMEPGWWGYITNGPTTVPLVASVAAAVAAPQRYTLTAFNLLEEQSLEWLAELCGLEPHLKGVYSSGGSVANLVALGAARQYAGELHGVDPGADGLGGLRLAVYASDETHHTVQRAAGVLGIGRSSVRRIGTDALLRMRADRLDDAIAADLAAGVVPMAVVATAGTTNTGSIDDLRALGEVARRRGAWFHVDGAYGLPGILDDRVTDRYDGLELADPAIVDPHKWLGAPIGIGATFVRDRSLLHRAFTQEPAAYLETDGGDADLAESSLDSMGVPYADLGVELSAQSRGVVVWSILRELGRAGVAARVRVDDDHARRVAELARRHPRLELLLEPSCRSAASATSPAPATTPTRSTPRSCAGCTGAPGSSRARPGSAAGTRCAPASSTRGPRRTSSTRSSTPWWRSATTSWRAAEHRPGSGRSGCAAADHRPRVGPWLTSCSADASTRRPAPEPRTAPRRRSRRRT